MPVKRLAGRILGKLTGKGDRRPPPEPMKKRSVASGRPPTLSAVEGLAPSAQAGGRVSKSKDPVADGASLATIEAGIQEVKERVEAGEPVLLLDVRQPEETSTGVIPGAVLIPLPELEARWKEVEDANEIICYCAKGGRSLKAATFLREKGLFNATSLQGGMTRWRELGGETVAPGAS